jgi:hypothetical protein
LGPGFRFDSIPTCEPFVREIGPGLRDALQPLIRVARRLSRADRRAWLDEMRGEAPAFAGVLEQLLNEPEIAELPFDTSKPDQSSP